MGGAGASGIGGDFEYLGVNNPWGNTWFEHMRVESNGNITLGGGYAAPSSVSLLVRIDALGNPVANFGSSGAALLTTINSTGANSIVRFVGFPDGNFLVAGRIGNKDGYLGKMNTSGLRPAAFNSGQLRQFAGSPYISKAYLEDMVVVGSVAYAVRLLGIETLQTVYVTAYNVTTGAEVATFGTHSGTTVLNANGDFWLNDARPVRLARDTDGKLYVALSGVANIDDDTVLLYRLNADGTIDDDFGSDGVASFPVSRPYTLTSVTPHPSGTIIVGGHRGIDENTNVVFHTFTSGGTFSSVTSFNAAANSGEVSLGSRTMAATLADDAGADGLVFTGTVPDAQGRDQIYVASHNPAGAPLALGFAPWLGESMIAAEPREIARLANGAMFVAGVATRANGTNVGVVLKYTASGALDTSFANQGVYLGHGRQGGHPWSDITETDGGKIVAVGDTLFIPGQANARGLILSRWNTDGSVDEDFGHEGFVYAYTTEVGARSVEQVHALPDGKLLMGGNYTTAPGEAGHSTIPRMALYRTSSEGVPDASFGTAGRTLLFFNGGGTSFNHLQVHPSGIYVGLQTALSHTSTFKGAVARFSTGGTYERYYFPLLINQHTFTVDETTGHLYVGGRSNRSDTGVFIDGSYICKVDADGAPITTYGSGSTVLIPKVTDTEVGNVKLLKLRPDGQLFAVSTYRESNAAGAPNGVRLTLISATGAVVSNHLLAVPGATSVVGQRFVLVNDESKLLIFGNATIGAATQGFVARVDLSGALDSTYGSGGVLFTTATYPIISTFDQAGDMIGMYGEGFLGGGVLRKLTMPEGVYAP